MLLKQKLDISTIVLLKSQLTAPDVKLNLMQQRVLDAISNETFAKQYMAGKHYETVVADTDRWIVSNIDGYNAYVNEHKNQLEKGFDKTVDRAKRHEKGLLITGAIGLARWGLHELFSHKKKKKKDDNDDDEKKGFFDSGFGKIIKYVGGGAIAYRVIKSLLSGKRPDGEKPGPDTPADLKNRYEKEVPEKQKIEYTKFGTMVDAYSKNIGIESGLGEMIDAEGKPLSISS